MKKLLLLSGLLGLLILGLAACEKTAINSNQTTNDSMENNANTNSAVVTDADKTDSKVADSDDGEFMIKAPQGGMAEVKLGELAASKAQNADVKAFGKLMVTDHSKANDELKAVAKKKNFTLPTDVNEDQKKAYDELAKLSGKEFDAKYVEMMVDDHEKDIDLFKKEADDGEDVDVKDFAAKTLPTLNLHYEKIKAIKDKMK
ncbi:MAG: DUF4142 domain-containing protein [Aridibacter sp.]